MEYQIIVQMNYCKESKNKIYLIKWPIILMAIILKKLFLSFFEQIQISPRIIFYIDGEEVSKENKGNNELDCIFINKSDKKVIPKNKFVTFKEVKQKTNEFHDEGNFSEIVVEKDVLMFMKVKTCWVALNKDNDNCDNVLKKLIKRSKQFANYFKRLLLVKEDVNILLLFIYNNSMIFNIKKEFGKIKDIYSSLDMKNTTLKQDILCLIQN